MLHRANLRDQGKYNLIRNPLLQEKESLKEHMHGSLKLINVGKQ